MPEISPTPAGRCSRRDVDDQSAIGPEATGYNIVKVRGFPISSRIHHKSSSSMNKTSEWKTFSDFAVAFSSQPDHVAAILSTSRMDHFLKQLIESRLLPCTSKEDDLLESDRGVGTFSNRIDLAYRLGIISALLLSSLHKFRRIRNTLAHTFEVHSFEHSPHRDRILEIWNQIKTPELEQFVKTKQIQESMMPRNRLFFLTSACVILGVLESRVGFVRRLEMQFDQPFESNELR